MAIEIGPICVINAVNHDICSGRLVADSIESPPAIPSTVSSESNWDSIFWWLTVLKARLLSRALFRPKVIGTRLFFGSRKPDIR
jgi:hypothetical protein